MCLLTFKYKEDPNFPFIFLGNRDESYDRPAIGAHFWFDAPDVLAGRDLEAGGTWLGLTRQGKFAAVTNQPFTNHDPLESRSRGSLLRRFLTQNLTLDDFTAELRDQRMYFQGYHLIYGWLDDLYFYDNVKDTNFRYEAGIHSLSNTKDDLSFHRQATSEKMMADWKGPVYDLDQMIRAFQDKQPNPNLRNYPADVPYEVAQRNSAIFIQGNENFGTVSTTALIVNRQGEITLKEVRYNRENVQDIVSHQFQLKRA